MSRENLEKFINQSKQFYTYEVLSLIPNIKKEVFIDIREECINLLNIVK